MGCKERVLSLDLEDSDYLYRIRRGTRIVYVSVQYTALIPTTDRTDSSRILARLRALPAWDEQWNTLTVAKTSEGVSTRANTFEPHRLSHLPISVPFHQFYNFLDLTVVDRISDRVSLVRSQHAEFVLKIARFSYELKALHTEITAYGLLAKFPFAPKFLGYVYEETNDRVIGFLMEPLHGRHPRVEDFEMCQNALQALHAAGVVHGDLNRYNIIIEDQKPKFIDFEAAAFQGDNSYMELELEETKGLAQRLADVSGIGSRGIHTLLKEA